MEKLSETHTLLKWSKGKPGGLKGRKDLQKDIEDENGVTDTSLLTVKLDCLGNDALKKVNNIHTSMDKSIKAEGQPWDSRGYWIFANHRVQKVQNILAQGEMDAERALEIYIDGYSAHVQSQRESLKDAFREGNYPTVEQLRDKHYIRYDIAPVPDPENDQRSGWTQDMRDRFEKQITKQQNVKVAASLVDLQKRLTPLVEAIVKNMDTYTGNREDGYFNDSMITKVRTLVEHMPDFNLGNDPLVEEVRRDLMSKITVLNPKILRADKSIRKDVSTDASKILKKIGAFGMPTDSDQ